MKKIKDKEDKITNIHKKIDRLPIISKGRNRTNERIDFIEACIVMNFILQ